MVVSAAASTTSASFTSSTTIPTPSRISPKAFSQQAPPSRMRGGGGNGSANGTSDGGVNGAGSSLMNGNFTPIPPAAPPAPLSTRRAQGLDMSSVEKRSLSSSKEISKRMRPHGLTEAPTYRPTEEEFKDPFTYIQSISAEGRKYGIIKIIPPDTWNPPFSIDTERFHFKTRRQELNSVEGGTRSNLNYLDQLHKFHKQQGTNLNRFPSVDKRPLDLYRLKKAVDIRGGFNKVCKLKKWAEIGRDLGYSGKIMSSLSTSLKNSYQRYLHPYEEYVKTAKPGVQQQLEAEYGGPMTPSPVPSPAGKLVNKHRFDSPTAEAECALRSSAALQTTTKDFNGSEKDSPMPDAPPSSVSGFTPMNMGGFTPVNRSFTPMNHGNRPSPTTNGVKTEEVETVKSPDGSATPEARPSSSGLSKRPLNNEDSKSPSKDNAGNEENSENGERRSKRLRKENAPTVAGSHMTLHRPSTPRLTSDRPSKSNPGEKCETCGKGDDATSLLLCDGCDSGYHTYCLDPPVKTIPERDWYCNRCLVGTGEFGFEDGPVYSLRQFQEKANNFKDNYFSGKMPFDPIFNGRRPVSEDDVEREFWRLVESVHETVEVEYGADIHSTTHGSGFPTMEREPLNKYSHDPWNLNILPLHPESLFRHIKSDVSGMTVPWLYVGMCFSTFCWHNEDHYTYSANYQHFGSTKTWYGIPASDAVKFEAAMREAVPELFETQPDLLFQLVTLLPPSTLTKAGVKVYALDQRAGQFVITFPQAYHAGFNHGFNFNEAVNFAPSDWEPFGREGVERYQEFRKAPVFSHDELLLTAAARDFSIKTAIWLAPALMKIRNRELQERGEIRDLIPGIQEQLVEEDLSEDQYQCGVCKAYTYLSQMTCSCTSNIACASHFRDICDCTNDKLIMRVRYTDSALVDLVAKVHEKANMPKQWTAKLEKITVESPRPPLKSLRSLLSEGEKIPCHIPELSSLKAFVDRANDWVEEATNYISRKQQNRRKNEKVWRKGSTKAAELEERDREMRKVENIIRLLDEAEALAFDAPEIEQLRERADAIGEFQQRARQALADSRGSGSLSTEYYEELVEAGRSFNVDLTETDQLEKIVLQLKWIDQAKEARAHNFMTLKEVEDVIKQGYDLGIGEENILMDYHERQRNAGRLWEEKAQQLMAEDPIHYPQLESLATQASLLPVQKETRAQVDQLLNKHREAQRQILHLLEQSKAPWDVGRPKYKEVREVLDALQDSQSKPGGTIDLEKELKRHEDWMRRGKKLFGKANAPLHILMAHMQYVEQRNNACFSLEDRPRSPAEPSSREGTPEGENSRQGASVMDASRSSRSREIFCICRQPEAGMMIECEVCHEWYHGKCLKIARGKVKEDEKYTCPICDHRVKIPRDAARPKLEDLNDWFEDITDLPFIPEEKECLERIISVAAKFRDHMKGWTGPLGLTSSEVPFIRFWLRKIEGAEILLTQETNFFRAELHRYVPIAPEAPPGMSYSLSTRKPRPTKAQRLMMQIGVLDPNEESKAQLKTKPYVVSGRKKSDKPTHGRSSTGLDGTVRDPDDDSIDYNEIDRIEIRVPIDPNDNPHGFSKDQIYQINTHRVSPAEVLREMRLNLSKKPRRKKSEKLNMVTTPIVVKPISTRDLPDRDSTSPTISQPAFYDSQEYPQGSPTFTRPSPDNSSPMLSQHSMIRGAGLDAMLYDAAPPTYGHGLPSAPSGSRTPPYPTVKMTKEEYLRSIYERRDLPNGHKVIFVNAAGEPTKKQEESNRGFFDNQIEDVGKSEAERAAEEARTLSQFSTIGDDDRDAEIIEVGGPSDMT